MAEVGLCGLLHLLEDHGGDLLGGEGLLFAVDVDLDGGLAVLLDELEGEVLGVLLEVGLAPLAADETLGVEDGVLGVLCGLVLGGVTDETLGSECDVRRGDSVTLVVGDNFDTAVDLSTDTRVGGSEIDTNDGSVLAALVSERDDPCRRRRSREP